MPNVPLGNEFTSLLCEEIEKNHCQLFGVVLKAQTSIIGIKRNLKVNYRKEL